MLLKLPAIKDEEPAGDQVAEDGKSYKSSAFKYPHVMLGALAIFTYLGVEVGIPSFFPAKFESLGLSVTDPTSLLSLYWGGLLVGRAFGSAILRKFSARKVLSGALLLSSLCLLLSLLTSGWTSLYLYIGTGLFHSIMWSCIFSLATVESGTQHQAGFGDHLHRRDRSGRADAGHGRRAGRVRARSGLVLSVRVLRLHGLVRAEGIENPHGLSPCRSFLRRPSRRRRPPSLSVSGDVSEQFLRRRGVSIRKRHEKKNTGYRRGRLHRQSPVRAPARRRERGDRAGQLLLGRQAQRGASDGQSAVPTRASRRHVSVFRGGGPDLQSGLPVGAGRLHARSGDDAQDVADRGGQHARSGPTHGGAHFAGLVGKSLRQGASAVDSRTVSRKRQPGRRAKRLRGGKAGRRVDFYRLSSSVRGRYPYPETVQCLRTAHAARERTRDLRFHQERAFGREHIDPGQRDADPLFSLYRRRGRGARADDEFDRQAVRTGQYRRRGPGSDRCLGRGRGSFDGKSVEKSCC